MKARVGMMKKRKGQGYELDLGTRMSHRSYPSMQVNTPLEPWNAPCGCLPHLYTFVRGRLSDEIYGHVARQALVLFLNGYYTYNLSFFFFFNLKERRKREIKALITRLNYS